MNNAKKINVNFSSLVGLKAELLKKQNEVNEAKLKSDITYTAPKVQKKKANKIKQEILSENAKNTEYIDDVNVHKKSKLMLEAKARLYERLRKSKRTTDNFLVDFKNKSESEDEIFQEEGNESNTSLVNEDEWVEYEDCFGRTRKCLREDLLLMQEKDQLIKQQIINKTQMCHKTIINVAESCVEEGREPEIEIMRRKWEGQTRKLADKVNIHYQDVLFDEARAHGVSYYAFSQDEEERSKQQENLFSLRKETEKKQKELKELKEFKEKIEHNRLKAAKIRQCIRAGLPIDVIEDNFRSKENNKSTSNVSNISNAIDNVTSIIDLENGEKINENVKNNNDLEKDKKIIALGELLGKKHHWYEMSQEEWIYKRRKVRDEEFAPVYEDFKGADNVHLKNNHCTSLNRQNDKKHGTIAKGDHSGSENGNDTDINSYNIPLPPTTATSNLHDHWNNLNETHNHAEKPTQTSHIADGISHNMIHQMGPSRSINEVSIAAGLRYLREKFEESQNT